MKFIIKRSSSYTSKPVPSAFKAMHVSYHVRTVTEDEYNRKFSGREGLWRSKGVEHGITKEGHIVRREKDVELWTIDIHTLDDIMTLADENGAVIFTPPRLNAESPEIEIYDDYRE